MKGWINPLFKGVLAFIWVAGHPAWAEEMLPQVAYPFVLEIDPGRKASLTLNGALVSVRLPNGQMQGLTKISTGGGQALVAQVADFNFDGMKDVAIATGTCTSAEDNLNDPENPNDDTVSQLASYHLYLWGRQSDQFDTKFYDSLCNLSLDAEGKAFTSIRRDGNMRFTTEYRNHEGKPYVATERRMLEAGKDGGKWGFGEWDYLVFFDRLVREIGHKVVTRGETLPPKGGMLPDARATIRSERADLLIAPDNSDESLSKMYLVKGDKVTLLDWRPYPDEVLGGAGWFLVRYQGKKGKVIEKWLNGEVFAFQAE